MALEALDRRKSYAYLSCYRYTYLFTGKYIYISSHVYNVFIARCNLPRNKGDAEGRFPRMLHSAETKEGKQFILGEHPVIPSVATTTHTSTRTHSTWQYALVGICCRDQREATAAVCSRVHCVRRRTRYCSLTLLCENRSLPSAHCFIPHQHLAAANALVMCW